MMFTKNYLVADIGATNTRIALVNSKLDFIKRAFSKNSDIHDIHAFIQSFVGTMKINGTCLAVASPLNADRSKARFTNIDWELDARHLSDMLKTEVLLINDFEALGFAIDGIKKDQYTELTSKGVDLSGNIAIIGAGTGTGMSILYNDGSRHYPILSEGAHSSIFFDPLSKLEMDLYAFLRKRKIAVEVETLVSGRGITTIYEFLLYKRYKHSPKVARDIKAAADKPAAISKFAMQDKDFLCIKTMELFMLFYSRAARDLALTTLCSTLVIAGGIAPKILPMMKDIFLEAFLMHEHIEARKLLEAMSVIVLTEPEYALYGCFKALKA